MEFKVGRPSTYDANVHLKPLCDAARKVHHLSVAASLCKFNPFTVKSWFDRGVEHLKSHNNTEFAQFSLEVMQAQAEGALALIESGKAGAKHHRFIQWFLSVTYHAEFGAEAEILKRLDAMESVILKLQGVNLNGQEMDSKSD